MNFEQFGCADGTKVKSSVGSGDEQRLPGVEKSLLAFLVREFTNVFQTDVDYERIHSAVVEMDRLVEVEQRRGEIVAVNQLYGAVGAGQIVGAVVGEYAIVDGVLRQFSMQFAGIAVLVQTAEVVDAVGNVAGLLDFGDGGTSADAVHSSCGKEEYIAFLQRVLGQCLSDAAVLNHAAIAFRVKQTIEAGIEVSVLLGMEDIPHLGLSERVVALAGQLVVRVHLYGEGQIGLNKFNKERKHVAVAFVAAAAYKLLMLFAEEVGHSLSLFGTFKNYRQ